MWTCKSCTLINEDWLERCDACYSLKSDDDVGASSNELSGINTTRHSTGTTWTCKTCTLVNEAWQDTCDACNVPKCDDSGGYGEQYCASGSKAGNFSCTDFAAKNEVRIVLIGRTGSGKSATGNTLLGFEEFQSLVSGSSVTNKCKRGEGSREDKKVIVVDTPGLFDTGMTNEKVTREIVKCIGMTSPGPHAMVLVVGIGRFTKEEQDTVKHFVDHFGEGMLRYMIVLFTRKDDLTKRNQSVHQYIGTVPHELKTILSKCGNRYIAFNNDATGYEKEGQVGEFFNMVDRMVKRNGGMCYTSEIYHEAELTLQRRMRAHREQLELQKRKEEENIKRQVSQQYHQKLEHERLQKSRLEDALSAKKEEEKRNKEENEKLQSEVRNLKQQMQEKERPGDMQNLVERKSLETRLEHLQQQLQANEARNAEREAERLQKQLDETNRRYEKELEQKEREIERQRKHINKQYEKKMSAEKLRKEERDNVENENDGAISDLIGGVKKVFSGLAQGGKKILKWFGF